MRLTFLGGADEVGASSTLIEMGGKRILVDAGIRISPRTSRGIQNDQLPDLHPIGQAGGPDVILVTHAHTDHTGALPLVVEQYPHVPVFATRPTQALTRILQKDAQRIMQSRHEEEGELPIFDEIAVQRLMDAFQTVEFLQPVRLSEGAQVTYHPAGHIAGAAMLVFESEEGTLVMSGDVSMNDQRAVVGARVPRVRADALVLESTYGGKLHANRVAEERRLIDTLKTVVERGGIALIPAFALGRAQEIIQIILAYRDQIDAPVYADGMVRAVCQGYTGFADLLPVATVRAARDKHLFFREKISAVTSAAMRHEIANSGQPAVIVASSGMLTGGASAAYAPMLAGDERNAILLTGYQDEEAPGRFLQRLAQDREQGHASIKIDGKPVTVRCDVGTYSLSAHADEAELVSMAEALDAQEIMLVHGDPGARHSLATALRQRGRRVISPRIAQTETFNFPRRPWAIGRVTTGSESRPLDPAALWDALKGQAGGFFSARELAQMWWGDAERGPEAARVLADSAHFAPDWRKRDTFQVRTEEQVARVQRQRAIMLANPDLVGKLIVLRDSNNRPRLARVVNAGAEGFEAETHGTKGRHYPADVLVWVIGAWERDPQAGGVKSQLNALTKTIKEHQDTLLPFARRQALVREGKPVQPADLLPESLPEGVSTEAALAAIVMALAGDGATVEQGGLLPRRALEDGPMEQNQAREVALESFPPESRLRKVGLEIHRKRLTLTFDFPDRAAEQYADEIERLEEVTGWEVRLRPGVNQQALNLALDELLPPGAAIVKGPSYYMDRREVQVEVAGVDDVPALERAFAEMTHFRLLANRHGGGGDSSPVSAQPTHSERMEINAAYAHIRDALGPLGLYKTSLKNGQIVLAFISPQVAERHTAIIARLAEETGYPISVHPHPNQQQITQIASALAREAGWIVRKGPGIHIDRGEVTLTLAAPPDAETLARVGGQMEEQTGYRLVVSGG